MRPPLFSDFVQPILYSGAEPRRRQLGRSLALPLFFIRRCKDVWRGGFALPLASSNRDFWVQINVLNGVEQLYPFVHGSLKRFAAAY